MPGYCRLTTAPQTPEGSDQGTETLIFAADEVARRVGNHHAILAVTDATGSAGIDSNQVALNDVASGNCRPDYHTIAVVARDHVAGAGGTDDVVRRRDADAVDP